MGNNIIKFVLAVIAVIIILCVGLLIGNQALNMDLEIGVLNNYIITFILDS